MTRRTGDVAVDFRARGAASFRRAVHGMERSLGRLDRSVRNLGRSVTGLGGAFATVQVARNFGRTAVQIERIGIRMRRLQQDDALGFLRDQADELGQSFLVLADQYSQFASAAALANFSVEEQRTIFRGVSQAAAALQLSVSDTQGVFRALTQVISKGSVQAEEIRGQIGERLPGAFELFAQSLGKTTAELNKMLELGQVSSRALIGFGETLTREFGEDAVLAADSFTAATNRLNNAWAEFVEETGPPVLNMLAAMAEGFTNLQRATDEAILLDRARSTGLLPVAPGAAFSRGALGRSRRGRQAARDAAAEAANAAAAARAAELQLGGPVGGFGRGELRRGRFGFEPALTEDMRRQQFVPDEPRGFDFGDMVGEARETFDQVEQFAIQAARNIQTNFADSIYFAMTGRFEDIWQSWVQLLARMASERLAQTLLGQLFGEDSGGGGLGGFLGGLFKGGATKPEAFASGGRTGFQPYIVGENGPELRVDGPGAIIPNDRVSIVQNNDFRGADAAILAGVPAMLDRRDAQLKADIFGAIRGNRAPIR